MQDTIKKSKYSNLERSLNGITCSIDSYRDPKLAVIAERKVTPMLRESNRIVVSSELKLDGDAQSELDCLYSNMIVPMGNKLNLMRAVAVAESDRVKKPDYIKGFMDFFVGKIEEEGLKDKSNIKKVIIYPQLLPELSLMGRHDEKFSDDIVEAVKASESNEELKKTIDAIVFAARAIR
jgi:hypothetical protein